MGIMLQARELKELSRFGTPGTKKVLQGHISKMVSG